MILRVAGVTCRKCLDNPITWTAFNNMHVLVEDAFEDAGINVKWIGWVYTFDTIDDENMALMMFGEER